MPIDFPDKLRSTRADGMLADAGAIQAARPLAEGRTVEAWIGHLDGLVGRGALAVQTLAQALTTTNPLRVGELVIENDRDAVYVLRVSTGGSNGLAAYEGPDLRALREGTAVRLAGVNLWSNAGGQLIASNTVSADYVVRVWTLRPAAVHEALVARILPTASRTEAEAGTGDLRRAWTPRRIAQAIAALAGTGTPAARDAVEAAFEERLLNDLEDRTRAIGYQGEKSWTDTADDGIRLAAVTAQADRSAGYAGLDYASMSKRGVTLGADVADLGLAVVLPEGRGPAGLRIAITRGGALKWTVALSHWRVPTSPPEVANLPAGARFYWYAPTGTGPQALATFRRGDVFRVQEATHEPVWTGAVLLDAAPKPFVEQTSAQNRNLMMAAGTARDIVGTGGTTGRTHAHDIAALRLRGHLTASRLAASLTLDYRVTGADLPDPYYIVLREGRLVPTTNGGDAARTDWTGYMGTARRMLYYNDTRHELISDTSKTITLRTPIDNFSDEIAHTLRGEPFAVVFGLDGFDVDLSRFEGRMLVIRNEGAGAGNFEGRTGIVFDRLAKNRYSMTPTGPGGAAAGPLTVGDVFREGRRTFNLDDSANVGHADVNGQVGYSLPYFPNSWQNVEIEIDIPVIPQ